MSKLFVVVLLMSFMSATDDRRPHRFPYREAGLTERQAAGLRLLEQVPGLHFNRGALLNAGALLLAGSEYDCLVFHDVDTVCGNVQEASSTTSVGRWLLRLG